MSSSARLSRCCKPLSLLPRVQPLAYSSTARYHASAARKDMVGPPDPVSHMRPMIYDNPASDSPVSNVRHPYSLTEFSIPGMDNRGPGEHELQLRLMRQQLDALHQNFWLDSNTRFYAARDSVLHSLPEGATARAKEEALSAFFRQWVMQEKDWTDSYTAEWRTRNFQLIKLSARVEFQKFKGRLSSMFKRS